MTDVDLWSFASASWVVRATRTRPKIGFNFMNFLSVTFEQRFFNASTISEIGKRGKRYMLQGDTNFRMNLFDERLIGLFQSGPGH